MAWQDKISTEVKEKINIEVARNVYVQKIKEKRENGTPPNFAERQAAKEMLAMLKQKGICNATAVHTLHFMEVTAYSGCGCCEHRRPKNYYEYNRQ